MDILTQELLTPPFGESEGEKTTNVTSRSFPLWWLEESKRNFDGLPIILSHLENKLDTFRQIRAGYIGETTPMEKQIVERISQMEQAVYEQGDCLRSFMQIAIEERENRISQKSKHVALRVWVAAEHTWNWLRANPILWLLGAISTFITYSQILQLLHK